MNIFEQEKPFESKTEKKSQSKTNPKNLNLGKTIEIPLPESKSEKKQKKIKSIKKNSFTINYLSNEVKEKFKDLAIKLDLSHTELIEYLVNKELTKFNNK